MNVKVTIELNTDTGEYTMQYNNLSSPGEPFDVLPVNAALKEIVLQRVERQDCEGEA